MDTDKENIKLILERSENPESVDSLENAIINLGYEPNDKCKYEWLEALETKPDFFKLIAEWGGLKKTAELLEYLFESERVYRRGNKQDAIDSNGVPMLSSFGRITRGVLEYVPDIIKFDGFEHGGNILHAVCDNGVGSIAEVVIETLDEFEPGLVQDLLQQYDSRERRPTTLAVNGKDISVLRLMALYDDGKRHEHVLEAVKKGELDYLKVLLEEREDVDDLLKGSVYESAAGAGNMGVWIFLAEKYPARAKTQQNLRSAVEKRRGKIVRYILEHYPEVLNEQEELLKTTQKAVKLSKKKEITTDGYNARRELSKDQKLSMEIEDLILDKMVRHLDPTVVKACWPSDDGRAAKEVSLELDLRSPLNWTWFAQIVKTAELEVKAWKEKEENLKKQENDAKRKVEEEAREKAEEEARRKTDAKKRIDEYSEVLKDLESLLEHSKNQDPGFREKLAATKQQVQDVLKQLDQDSRPKPLNLGTLNRARGRNNRIRDPQMNGVKTHENQLSNYHSMQTVTYSSRYNVDFQPYLKSVTIPNLDHFRTHECAAEISHLVGNEVKHILDWLRLVKGVRRILKLRVLDSRHRPHSEQTIEEAIKGLDVEELDWKRLDLSTKTVEEAAKRAHTLYLYCSGSWTPIYHWISPGGLESLKAVKRLHITIIKDTESGITTARTQDQEKKLSDWLQEQGWKSEAERPSKELSEDDKRFWIRSSPWIIAGPPAAGNRDVAVVRDPRTVIRLSKFVPWYQKINVRARRRPIRVAILDSGVDLGEFETTNGVTGDSFSGGHWWLSSERHGTQMAKIIRAIDPCCDLFMAKVADHRRSITIEAVVKALTRVTKDEVDVISMSFTLDNKSPSLETAIVQASKKGIVLLCSTADEGENRAHAWPASFSEALAIAACSDAGEKLLTSTTEAQYYFRGENVLYDSVRGGNSSVEKISGSSVATAIAAGVASLCLACCRIDNTEVPNGSKKVAELFDKAKEGKYVRPWVLFGETRRGDSDPMFL